MLKNSQAESPFTSLFASLPPLSLMYPLPLLTQIPETGGGEGYVQMLRNSMESIKVLNKEKCYSVNNIALSL